MRHGGKQQLFPLLRVAVALILGIVAGNALAGDVPLPVWMLLAAASLLLSFLFMKSPLLQGGAILLTVFFFGGWLMTKRERDSRVDFSEGKEAYEAVVISAPVLKKNTVRCDLLVAFGRLKGRKLRAFFVCRHDSAALYMLRTGVGVWANSVLRPPEDRRIGGKFDYGRWMKVQGYAGSALILPRDWQPRQVSLTSLSPLQRAGIAALRTRERLLQRYRMTDADSQSQAVVAAMTLSDKSALTGDLREIYSVTGAAHVLALSGLHLGVIYMILSLLFDRRRWRLPGRGVIILTIWAYALMTGMTPSVLRSATMFTVYAIVSLLQRDKASINVLSLTAVVMLCLNPMCLWDAGAQMSFLAVAGILVFYGPIYYSLGGERLQGSRLLRWIWAMTAVSVASQLGVAPLIMFHFGRFSCCFLLTNMVAVPLSTIIIHCAFFMFLTSSLPVLGGVFSSLLFASASLLNHSLAIIASLPCSSIEGINVGPWQTLMMYVLVACLYGIGGYLSAMRRSSRHTWK